MKPSRTIAISAVALLLLSAASVFTYRAFAQPVRGPSPQSQECVDEGADSEETELECGQPDEVESQEGATASGADDTEQDGQETTPAGALAIPAEAAQSAAEAYLNAGAATSVELDEENGRLVYSVEIDGTDVIVDAATGAVLGEEAAED